MTPHIVYIGSDTYIKSDHALHDNTTYKIITIQNEYGYRKITSLAYQDGSKYYYNFEGTNTS